MNKIKKKINKNDFNVWDLLKAALLTYDLTMDYAVNESIKCRKIIERLGSSESYKDKKKVLESQITIERCNGLYNDMKEMKEDLEERITSRCSLYFKEDTIKILFDCVLGNITPEEESVLFGEPIEKINQTIEEIKASVSSLKPEDI